jgi:hypothetical protein
MAKHSVVRGAAATKCNSKDSLRSLRRAKAQPYNCFALAATIDYQQESPVPKLLLCTDGISLQGR